MSGEVQSQQSRDAKWSEMSSGGELRRESCVPTWLLLIAMAIPYFATLGCRPLIIPDETRYAEIGREIVTSGDWVVPRLLGLRYFEKPMGGYWLNGLSQLAFGHSNFAVRLPSAVSTVVTAALVGLLVWRALGDRRQARLAALIYLSSFVVWAIGTTVVLDGLLTMWLTAALSAFWFAYSATRHSRRLTGWAVFGVCSGAAALTKGFVAFAVVGVIVVPLMLWEGRWREMLGYGAVSATLALLVTLPWAITIHSREPEFWKYFFWNENIRRFSADNAQHRQPFWYYVPCLVAMTLPWTAALPRAVGSGWRALATPDDRFTRFVAVAALAPFLLFSAAKGKLATYILPCMPFVAILIANSMNEAPDRRVNGALRMSVWVTATLSGAALFGLLGIVAIPSWNPLGSSGTVIAVAGGITLSWIGLSVGAIRGRLPLVAALGLLVTFAALGQEWLIPSDIRSYKAPEAELAKYAANIKPEVRITSASVALAPALAWVFQRADIVVMGGSGELELGLGYPDGAGRHVPKSEFAGWLRDQRARQPVALFFRSKRADAFDRYPPSPTQVRNGGVGMIYYEKTPIRNHD